MKQHSSAIVGGLLGVLLLVVVAVFAIFLPKADSGSPSVEKTSTAAPELPSRIGSLVALDSGNLPSVLSQQVGDSGRLKTAQRTAAQGLDKIYGVPAVYRIYATPDAKTLAAVTVLNREPGLFSPDGPPVGVTSGQQTSYQLSRVSGAVCAEYFAQPAQGQTGAATVERSHCQMGAHGRTYDIDVRGFTPSQAVRLLKKAAA